MKIETTINLGRILEIIAIGVVLYLVVIAFSGNVNVDIESHECKTLTCVEFAWGLVASCSTEINERCMEPKNATTK